MLQPFEMQLPRLQEDFPASAMRSTVQATSTDPEPDDKSSSHKASQAVDSGVTNTEKASTKNSYIKALASAARRERFATYLEDVFGAAVNQTDRRGKLGERPTSQYQATIVAEEPAMRAQSSTRSRPTIICAEMPHE
jgi:hypothetical protein